MVCIMLDFLHRATTGMFFGLNVKECPAFAELGYEHFFIFEQST